jgi:hypothetical protein
VLFAIGKDLGKITAEHEKVINEWRRDPYHWKKS